MSLGARGEGVVGGGKGVIPPLASPPPGPGARPGTGSVQADPPSRGRVALCRVCVVTREVVK